MIWYVSPSGSDSNSCAKAQNQSTPKKTISKAIECAGTDGSSDTVVVGNGTYTETIWKVPGGVEGRPFTLKAANTLGATLKPSGGERILSIGYSNVVVDGFVLDGSNVQGNNVWMEGVQNVVLQNCELKNIQPGGGGGENSFQAIFGYNVAKVIIRGCLIHDVGTSRYSHGIYWVGGGSLFEDNIIWNVGGNGIQIYGSGNIKLSDNVVRNNRIFDFAQGGVANGIYSGGINELIYNNVCYQTKPNPNAVGISVEGGGPQILHNTIYQCGYMGIAAMSGVAKNNICYMNGADIEGSIAREKNLIDTDPEFVSLSGFDFHLTKGSPAVDAGGQTQVTTDIEGTARQTPDIGAYEYGESDGGGEEIEVALAVSPTSPQPVGTRILLTVGVVNSSKAYEYKWWFRVGTMWKAMLDWSTNFSYGWVPTSPGTYMWSVWVRPAGSAIDSGEHYADTTYTIT